MKILTITRMAGSIVVAVAALVSATAPSHSGDLKDLIIGTGWRCDRVTDTLWHPPTGGLIVRCQVGINYKQYVVYNSGGARRVRLF